MSNIKISGLVKKYGSNKVLDNIALEFEEGKIYGLLGRNGAGKTTLLNCITNRGNNCRRRKHYRKWCGTF